MVDITILGTSALLPTPERALTAVQLACEGRSILFDCGEGTQTAARKAGVSLFKTDVIALTHYHGDHIFGLPGLLQTMNVMGRREKLVLVGPAEIRKELAPILVLAGSLAFEVQLLELPQEGVVLNSISGGWPQGARLIPFPTEHRVISQGYCFELPRPGKFKPEKARALGIPEKLWGVLQKGSAVTLENGQILPQQVMGDPRKGIKVVFSGDTAKCSSLIAAAEGADLLICEATYGENEQALLAEEHGHMNFTQAAQVAKAANVERLWLVHYSQMVEDPQMYLPNAAAWFAGTECGADGKRCRLRFE
ncbi:MAG: ribonuclease Z [Oscillospiraceae bacterium]|nr:ribonuclease Z [Oscillospiraceae bacterium]